MSAPDITPDALAGRGWSRDNLVTYFQTGVGPSGPANGEMFAAVKHSLTKLTDKDRIAIATYLMNGAVGSNDASGETGGVVNDALTKSEGHKIYLRYCSVCHKPNGEGVPNVMPPLQNNASIVVDDPKGLVDVIVNGFRPVRSSSDSKLASWGPMPGYRNRLSAGEIATLTDYLRERFGSKDLSKTSTEQVREVLETE